MLCSEFTSKLFHARINEYFPAAEEIEQSGKAVTAEQGSSDNLKMFSSMKSKPISAHHTIHYSGMYYHIAISCF